VRYGMNEKITITECPTCGSSKITNVKKDWIGSYNGRKYMVPSLEYYECPNCNEKIYDKNAMKRIQEKSPAFKKHPPKKAA
jgi:YgiT-type zinc finger domain-containing protein